MKKIICLITVMTILTGCGTSKVNGGNNTNTESNNSNIEDNNSSTESSSSNIESSNSSIESNNSDKSGNSNKKLVCITEFDDDSEGNSKRSIKETFTFDKDGKKMEMLTSESSLKYKKGKLDRENIEENQKFCKNADSAKGVSCEYTVQEDGKITQFFIEVDFANLDKKGKEISFQEGYSELAKLSLERTKEYMENDREYECEVK